MKKFIKNNLRLIIIFIIGIVVSTTIVSAATILFASSDVNFSSNVIASKNVKDAIDEVCTSFNDGCFPGYDKGTVSGGTYTCTKKSSIPDQALVFDSSDVLFDNSNGNLTSTNVADALDEIAAKVPYCKEGYTKTNEQSNSYNCKKTITITANNQTITYGSNISQNTNQVTVEGLETGHSLTGITLTASTANVPGGTITPSSAIIEQNSTNVASTYNINYVTGTLTINRKNVSFSCSNKTYNGSSQTACSCGDSQSMTGTYAATNASSTVYTAYCTPDSNHTVNNSTSQVSATWTMSKASGNISLSASSGSVSRGRTANFFVTSHHGGTISCTSGDTSKVTCSVYGTTVTVTGVSLGSATLTVTSGATANYNAASTTYTATTSPPSWHYYYNDADASYCQSYCPYYCQDEYSTEVWSCVTGRTDAPSGPSLATGKYCWCKY